MINCVFIGIMDEEQEAEDAAEIPVTAETIVQAPPTTVASLAERNKSQGWLTLSSVEQNLVLSLPEDIQTNFWFLYLHKLGRAEYFAKVIRPHLEHYQYEEARKIAINLKETASTPPAKYVHEPFTVLTFHRPISAYDIANIVDCYPEYRANEMENR